MNIYKKRLKMKFVNGSTEYGITLRRLSISEHVDT